MYRLDLKKKEYKVVTFAQLRKEWEDAQAEARKNAEDMKKFQGEEGEQGGKQLEFTADAKETGQRRNIAGYDAREVTALMNFRSNGPISSSAAMRGPIHIVFVSTRPPTGTPAESA